MVRLSSACAVQFPNEPADLFVTATQDGDEFTFTVTGERADEVEAGAVNGYQEDIAFFVYNDSGGTLITQEGADEDGQQVFMQTLDFVEGSATLTFYLYDYDNNEYALISVNEGPTVRRSTVSLPVRSPSMQSGLHATCIRRRCRLAA